MDDYTDWTKRSAHAVRTIVANPFTRYTSTNDRPIDWDTVQSRPCPISDEDYISMDPIHFGVRDIVEERTGKDADSGKCTTAENFIAQFQNDHVRWNGDEYSKRLPVTAIARTPVPYATFAALFPEYAQEAKCWTAYQHTHCNENPVDAEINSDSDAAPDPEWELYYNPSLSHAEQSLEYRTDVMNGVRPYGPL
jgi:hypothetical protein